jgi:hypothetical protein
LIEEEIVVMGLGTLEAIDQTKLELLRQVSNSECLRNLVALNEGSFGLSNYVERFYLENERIFHHSQ